MKSRDEVSAGGVVFRRSASGIEVLVCKASSYHKWVLPKGLVNQGETFEQTAVREVEEEVGVHARIADRLGEPEKYVYTARGVRVFKSVHYFLMEFESGNEKIHDREMEDVQWMSLDKAIELVEYKGAKEVLKRAKVRLGALSTQ
jgi:8-oxo-dGTP diphosphatase